MPNAPSPNFSKSRNWCRGNSGTAVDEAIVFRFSMMRVEVGLLAGMCKVVKRSPLSPLFPAGLPLPLTSLEVLRGLVLQGCMPRFLAGGDGCCC